MSRTHISSLIFMVLWFSTNATKYNKRIIKGSGGLGGKAFSLFGRSQDGDVGIAGDSTINGVSSRSSRNSDCFPLCEGGDSSSSLESESESMMVRGGGRNEGKKKEKGNPKIERSKVNGSFCWCGRSSSIKDFRNSLKRKGRHNSNNNNNKGEGCCCSVLGCGDSCSYSHWCTTCTTCSFEFE